MELLVDIISFLFKICNVFKMYLAKNRKHTDFQLHCRVKCGTQSANARVCGERAVTSDYISQGAARVGVISRRRLSAPP